jgi:16S rRNA processing protein RimM
MAKDILLAAVMGAQGLKGEMKVKTFTAAPEALRTYGRLHSKDGRQFEITAFRLAKPGEAVISFQGVTDRNAAEALKGTELFVKREVLPEPGEEEFYHADLVGLEGFDSEGRLVGKVAGLHNFGAGDVLELTRADGDAVLIAFTKENVPVIDIAGGRITVAVPEDDEDNDHVE